jgi:anti-sigma factor RsiW
MNDARQCATVREDLAAYRGGWLGRTRMLQVERHLAGCAACATELRRDEGLEAALQGLEGTAPRPVTWQQVRAARTPVRSRAALTRPAWVFSAAAATAALAALLVFGTHRQAGMAPHVADAPIAATAASDTAAPILAHNLVSAGDISGDPNRAMLLVYGAPSVERTVR